MRPPRRHLKRATLSRSEATNRITLPDTQRTAAAMRTVVTRRASRSCNQSQRVLPGTRSIARRRRTTDDGDEPRSSERAEHRYVPAAYLARIARPCPDRHHRDSQDDERQPVPEIVAAKARPANRYEISGCHEHDEGDDDARECEPAGTAHALPGSQSGTVPDRHAQQQELQPAPDLVIAPMPVQAQLPAYPIPRKLKRVGRTGGSETRFSGRSPA
jgi:hypothetical protein